MTFVSSFVGHQIQRSVAHGTARRAGNRIL
jgi:hypothetical protein